MARNTSIASVIERNRIASSVAFIPLIRIGVKDPDTGEIVETLRFARNSEDFVWQGETWIKGSFDFDLKQSAGALAELTMTVKDLTRAVQARMQQYGGGVGFDVQLLLVNTGNPMAPPEMDESFIVVGASAKDFIVTFRLGAENPLTMRCPRRKQFRDRCEWRYKSPECGYTGDMPTCSLTLQGPNGCRAHGNSRRFGGFPGLKMRQ